MFPGIEIPSNRDDGKSSRATCEIPLATRASVRPVATGTESANQASTSTSRLDTIRGSYCLVRYERKVYLGAILNTDASFMQKNGTTKRTSFAGHLLYSPTFDVIGIMHIVSLHQIGNSVHYSDAQDIFVQEY